MVPNRYLSPSTFSEKGESIRLGISNYSKRWDIDVFFKIAKQHLKLIKEIQCRDFDSLIPIPASCSCGICFWPTNAG